MPQDIQILMLVKGEERYIFLYDDDMEHRSECLLRFGQFAKNPELSFSWSDAAVLSQRMRRAELASEETNGGN